MKNGKRSTVTKSKLAAVIKKQARLTSSKDSLVLINGIINTITDCLLEKDAVKIRGLGSFVPAVKGHRVSRNPKTGEIAPITKWNTVRFKIAPSLKRMIMSVSREIF